MEKHYKIVNLTKREFVHPHKLNTGLKLCDIYHSRRIGQAVILLCTDPSSKEEVLGRWAGDRIALVNDEDPIYVLCAFRETVEDEIAYLKCRNPELARRLEKELEQKGPYRDISSIVAPYLRKG